MVKRWQFEEISVHADNEIKHISSIQNIGKYGDKYYFMDFDETETNMMSSSDFESDDIDIGWDGKYKGRSLDTGVYIYYVNVEFQNKETLVKTGDLTLIR